VNKVDVEVRVVILFEIDWEKILRCDSDLSDLKLVKKHLQHDLVLRCDLFSLLLLLSLCTLPWELNLDLFGLELSDVSVCGF
jgi:hypothetical protein